MPDLVFELGTEELPANACESALEQLRAAVEAKLMAARLPAVSVQVFGTPRRMIVLATGVPPRQPDLAKEAKGPSRSAAYDANGNPTGAAIGFAKKQGIAVESLGILISQQGEYVVARVVEQGKPSIEVLGAVLEEAVESLNFPKMMRWGDGAVRFARPVRWILALLDSAVVPVEIAGIKSGRKSRGHRFLSPDEFEVSNTSEFLGKLRAAYVIYDPQERLESIRSQANRLAASLKGSIPWDEDLLNENNWLVEWPTALAGSFDAAYLELPRPVLTTAMKKHQRFFPLEDKQGNLLPKFIAVRSGGDRAIDVVREGNERVLSARFNDARFFYQQDRETPLAIIGEKLGRILFQEKLGTLAEKRWRLELLVRAAVESLGWNADEKEKAARAATLCKADLASHMVAEIPALQGIVGREYALSSGEDPEVADAIAEHYKPKSAGDSIAETRLGKLLALVDRLDTLVGYVGIGILPSGSSDPFGLRRAAHGAIQILADVPEMPPLHELQLHAAQAYREANNLEFNVDDMSKNLGGLFDQRMEAFLQDRGIRYDLIDAALSGGATSLMPVHAVVRRAEALRDLAGDPEFVPLVTVAGRVANILRGTDRGTDHTAVRGSDGYLGSETVVVESALRVLESKSRNVEQSLLDEPSERRLYAEANRRLPEIAGRAAEYDFQGLYRALIPLRPAVDKFFDDVLVMVEDPAVRDNRLALLRFVDALYKALADFTKVVMA